MPDALQFPIIDLSFPDRFSIANLIRQGCVDHGFFYLENHGVDEELISKVFEQSSNFFSLPIEEKMKLVRKNHRGYTALYAEKLDTTLTTEGDSKESFYIGPLADDLNQWPLEEDLPSWRSTMETYHQKLLSAVTKLLSLIALSLKLEEDFFEKVGALIEPLAFIRLLHYPGDLNSSSEEIFGASAHSDYGMVTLLVTDGVPGLQGEIQAATSLGGCTKHEWVAFFTNPSKDCIVECLESCCTESCPPRFPPIKAIDYLEERLRLTYGL
ncbi:2-oxoglutarate-Fe(II) type oxidoreductase ppzD isoform X6 [Gossypium hirsutum]|uniref:2-oxoglutarate-Fe(II) type oxidoreductase ppzD isoform X6 n=1 Tax=Gossypium hirsutum TaxID=3635 RepID=A0ABM3AI36_GOSHI|nr:2-oxoglutarate-Fe(II) type oxidoreductase ppzD isoform X6 [Gossypium hirsutum]